MVNDSKGALAWWTSGDNAKAMVNTDRAEKPKTTIEWQNRVRSNGRADAETFGLAKVDEYAPENPVPSTGNLELAATGTDLRKIHDLTAFSRGLLTNTATGGWRKDLSLMSEKFSSLPSSNLPFFTLVPGKDQTYSKAQNNSTAGNPIIYPWAKYRNDGKGAPWQQVPPICSWSALVDYTQQYTKLPSSGSASKTTMSPTFAFGNHYDGNQRLDFQDKVRRTPQIARVQWVFSLGSGSANAVNDPDDAKGANRGKTMPGVVVTPVVTLWNPYNVELEVSSFSMNIQEIAPLLFTFKVGDRVLPNIPLSVLTRSKEEIAKWKEKKEVWYQRFNLKIGPPNNPTIKLAPGASRIFSMKEAKLIETGASNDVQLVEGYKPRGGYIFYRLDGTDPKVPKTVYAAPETRFSIEKISYDAVTTEGGNNGQGGKAGLGMIYDISFNGTPMSAHRMIYDAAELGGKQVVDSLYPPLTNRLSVTLSEVSGTNCMPFSTAVFGYRVASPFSPIPRDPKFKHLYTKGMLQANPLCFYTEIGFGDDNSAVTTMAGTGVYHPINAPYDFAFHDVQGWGDNFMPEWDSTSKSTFIVTGMKPSDGLTRCVIAELPTRPLQSLAELQHFDARNNNPIPPFHFNLIGNGSAHPLFAPDQVSIKTAYNDGMCNDDSYILNHLLFDDWFFSSIAKDVRDFGSGTRRSINNVYQDHLSLTTPLPNRCYVAAQGADSPKLSDAVSAAMATSKDSKTGKYQFETIASKLEVDGMFNINSASIEAWKAILRHSRDLQVPYLAANGSTNLGKASSFPYPRTSIAGDQGSDSGSKASGATFPAAAEFAGYRVLTDEQIDALAEEIVKEIRKRGPFLSLAEFVNRRLSTDKDLAIASAIQKALDNLANMGGSPKNPFAAMQASSDVIAGPPPGKTDYKFPEAALGSTAFGLPGWIRQADILKPLAPIISARDDTFTIRAYGDSREKGSPTKILARAWCEVVVKRNANYVDPSEPAGVAPFSALMKSAANKRFGRRYDIVSFRWLNEKEV